MRAIASCAPLHTKEAVAVSCFSSTKLPTPPAYTLGVSSNTLCTTADTSLNAEPLTRLFPSLSISLLGFLTFTNPQDYSQRPLTTFHHGFRRGHHVQRVSCPNPTQRRGASHPGPQRGVKLPLLFVLRQRRGHVGPLAPEAFSRVAETRERQRASHFDPIYCRAQLVFVYGWRFGRDIRCGRCQLG